MAFAAGANGTIVGLGAPTHVTNPVFDPKLPGSWLVDLSHVDLSRVKSGKEWVELDSDLLPSPFTPKGERPEGPAWYATPTVAYAAELGYDVAPTEAYVRWDNGRYLDGWYNRLRDAYIATMADLGVDRRPDAGRLPHCHGRLPQQRPRTRDRRLRDQGDGEGRHRQAAREAARRGLEARPALARPGPADMAPGHPCRGHLQDPYQHAPQDAQARRVHRPVPGRGPVRLRRLRRRRPQPARLPALPGRQAAARAASGSASRPGWSSTRAPRACCGAKGYARNHGPDLNLARFIKDGSIIQTDTGE